MTTQIVMTQNLQFRSGEKLQCQSPQKTGRVDPRAVVSGSATIPVPDLSSTRNITVITPDSSPVLRSP